MPMRSLKHEYATYVEYETERYKDSISRPVLLKLADDAVTTLTTGQQLELSELVLCDAVNELIKRRLKLPNYDRWRRNRLKILEQFRRADHWGLSAAQRLVEAVRPEEHPHVLVAGPHVQERTLYLAAHGAHVTAVTELDEDELVEQVLCAAATAGLSGQVEGCADGLDGWAPSVPLRAVVWHAQVLASLAPERRARVIAHLQAATAAGGVHYIEGVPLEQRAGSPRIALMAEYAGWQAPVDSGDGIIVLHKPRVA